jgi:hypothetical protein
LNPLTRVVVARCEFDEDVDLVRGLESTRLLAAAGTQPITTRYLAFFPWCGKLLRRAERLALLAAASRMLPLPLYPDQLARLRARKPADSAAARLELAFRPRPLRNGLADIAHAA